MTDQPNKPSSPSKGDALSTQIGGSHYKGMKIQPMEYSMANGLDACQHTAIKYITRHKIKGGKEDLLKAIHCIELLIGFCYPEPKGLPVNVKVTAPDMPELSEEDCAELAVFFKTRLPIVGGIRQPFLPSDEVAAVLSPGEEFRVDPFAVDWSASPEWANYHAVDAIGVGFWYEARPIPNVIAGTWYYHPATVGGSCGSGFDRSACRDIWQESLRERPEIISSESTESS